MEVIVVLLLFVVAIIVTGAKVVPQGEEWIVERLGKYHATLKPGLNVIIPLIDRVAYQVPTKELILDTPRQEVITRDNAVVVTNAIVFFKVTDPARASYSIMNFTEAVRNLTMTTLRSIIGEMQLNEALGSREQIKANAKERIKDEFEAWGLTLGTVEIQEINPSANLQMAMEKQAAAEREKQALIMRAEGEKQAMILEAEGKLQAAKLEAEAQVALAEGSKKALEEVAQALSHSGEIAPNFLIAQKYVESLQKIASSDSAKTILYPADLQEAVRVMLGRLRG
ncbi:MAG: SPFH/Band 7/PHB domain protein [Campylobacterales bacterium]